MLDTITHNVTKKNSYIISHLMLVKIGNLIQLEKKLKQKKKLLQTLLEL